MYSLPVRRLKEILNRVVPDVSLGPVEELSSTQLARLYTLSMSDGRKLLLSFAPSLAVRLLRHEGTMLSSEATLIHFITETARSQGSEGSIGILHAGTPLAGLVHQTIGKWHTLIVSSNPPLDHLFPQSRYTLVFLNGVVLTSKSALWSAHWHR